MTDTKSPKPSGGGPVFFLSYARPSAAERVQGDPDRDFAAFYYDLCAALTRFAPVLGAVARSAAVAARTVGDDGASSHPSRTASVASARPPPRPRPRARARRERRPRRRR